jgi:predicted house-cleaning noncanonical NTP pyrophosphatase (MazG superfamily)
MPEYRGTVAAKLAEETSEMPFADDADAPEELADFLEVVLALASDLGLDVSPSEQLRTVKAAKHGGFAGRIVWSGNVMPNFFFGCGKPIR